MIDKTIFLSRWRRICTAASTGCEHYTPGVPGSEGITALGLCDADLRMPCEKRSECPIEVMGHLKRLPVVAGFEYPGLLLPGKRLYDVLPCIHARDFWFLLSWARDYTIRRIPWAATRKGLVYTLWVERRV